MGVDPREPAKAAGPGQFAGEGEVGQVSPLGACLEDGAAAVHRVAMEQRLDDVFRAGLLAIDVFTGLGGKHRHLAVPVGSGGDQDCIDILAGEQVVEVAVGGARGGAVVCIDQVFDPVSSLFLDIADGGELDVGLLEEAAEVVLAPAADPDSPDHDSLARRYGAIEPEGRGGNDRRGGDGGEAGCDETSPGQRADGRP